MTEGAAVLDASALLAFLFDERGADAVQTELPGSVMSTVNWSETAQWLLIRGADPDEAYEVLSEAGLHLEPLSRADADEAARLHARTRGVGLSLADRCCLALARRMGATALTADSAWSTVDAGVRVKLVR